MHDLAFHDRLAPQGSVLYALVELHIEALERLVGVEGFPQLLVFFREVRGQYPGIVDIEMADQEEHCHAGVSHKHVIDGGEISVLKGRQELVAECGVNVTTLVILSMLFHMI